MGPLQAIEDFLDLFSGCSTWNFQVESPCQPFWGGLKGESVAGGGAVIRYLDPEFFREKVCRVLLLVRGS